MYIWLAFRGRSFIITRWSSRAYGREFAGSKRAIPTNRWRIFSMWRDACPLSQRSWSSFSRKTFSRASFGHLQDSCKSIWSQRLFTKPRSKSCSNFPLPGLAWRVCARFFASCLSVASTWRPLTSCIFPWPSLPRRRRLGRVLGWVFRHMGWVFHQVGWFSAFAVGQCCHRVPDIVRTHRRSHGWGAALSGDEAECPSRN